MKLLFASVLAAAAVGRPALLDEAAAGSVMVQAGEAAGSGVVFKNGPNTFVWTNAHVLSDAQHKRLVASTVPDGHPWVEVLYADVWVVTHEFEGGRKTGEDWKLAKIVRYSPEQDLALLHVFKAGWGRGSVRFSTGEPGPGDPVWHVGNPSGGKGFGSVSDGLVGAVGRLRRLGSDTDVTVPKVYDQVSAPAYPGSSGGGVFDKKTGRCIGLLSEFLDAKGALKSHSAMCVVPARRIRAFAKDFSCEWALDASVKVPDRFGEVTCDPVPLPPTPATKPISP